MRRLLVILLLLAGCGEGSGAPAGPARIASLSPAATSLLRAVGAGGRLVAVSNYEPDARGLPRVGDYLTVDWEKLAASRADVMVVQVGAGRVPPGLTERADRLGIEVVRIEIDTLADVGLAMEQFRTITGDDAAAFAALSQWRADLRRTEAASADRPPVRTLVATSNAGGNVMAAGPGTYLDELLAIAGGENVVAARGWPTLDAERLAALSPAIVIHLLPAPTPRQRAEAEAAWADLLPGVPVEYVTDADALLPGYNTAALAGELARRLAEHAPAGAASANSLRPSSRGACPARGSWPVGLDTARGRPRGYPTPQVSCATLRLEAAGVNPRPARGSPA